MPYIGPVAASFPAKAHHHDVRALPDHQAAEAPFQGTAERVALGFEELQGPGRVCRGVAAGRQDGALLVERGVFLGPDARVASHQPVDYVAEARIHRQDTAEERAIDGIEEPIVYKGKIMKGTVNKVDNKLLDKVMTAGNKDKYADQKHIKTTGVQLNLTIEGVERES